MKEGDVMLKEQRQMQLLKLVDKHQFVRVDELAQYLKCAEITIRRDIHELDQQKKLVKVHGGAKSLNDRGEMFDESVENRQQTHMVEKKKIARSASRYIQDHLSIYLDAGSSVECLIEYLKGKDVMVYTHGIHHIPLLLQYHIPFSVIGGSVKPQTQVCVGEVALMQLQMLHFNLAFIGANAYDEEFGFSTPDMSEALIKQTIIKQSNQVYVLIDQSKFNKRSHVRFAKLEDITEIISD